LFYVIAYCELQYRSVQLSNVPKYSLVYNRPRKPECTVSAKPMLPPNPRLLAIHRVLPLVLWRLPSRGPSLSKAARRRDSNRLDQYYRGHLFTTISGWMLLLSSNSRGKRQMLLVSDLSIITSFLSLGTMGRNERKKVWTVGASTPLSESMSCSSVRASMYWLQFVR
jgi:hypothetical protein